MRKPVLFLYLLLAGGMLQAQFSIPNAIVEEFTGAWCGYCPDEALILEDIVDANPEKAIAVGVHSGDAMEFPDGQAVASFYTSSYPSAAINRKGAALGRNQWVNEVNATLQGACAVGVSLDSVTWNSSTREITAIVRGSFTGPVAGDIRVGFMITEDNVTGTGAGYNQANYFNTTAGHHYQGAGDPISGFVHRHTLRHMMGGSWGTTGIIPNSINPQEAFTHTYTYTLPAGYDENQINLIAYVGMAGNDVNSREILNSEEMHLPLATGISAEDFNGFLEVGPNPFDEVLNIGFGIDANTHVQIDVLNPMGQLVRNLYDGNTNAGAHSYEWNGTDNAGNAVANGVYLLTLTAGEQRITKRVMLSR